MRTTKQLYRVDRRQISMIRFIFEAYEGLAVLTTVDSAAGVVSLSVAPGCEDTAKTVMDDLAKDILIEPLEFTSEEVLSVKFAG